MQALQCIDNLHYALYWQYKPHPNILQTSKVAFQTKCPGTGGRHQNMQSDKLQHCTLSGRRTIWNWSKRHWTVLASNVLHIKSPTFSAIYCAIYVVYLILHWAGKRPRTERIWGLLQVILHKLWKNFHFVKTHIFCYADYLNDILDTWNT